MEWCLVLSKTLKGKYSVKELYLYDTSYLYVNESFQKIVLHWKVATVLLVLQFNNTRQFQTPCFITIIIIIIIIIIVAITEII